MFSGNARSALHCHFRLRVTFLVDLGDFRHRGLRQQQGAGCFRAKIACSPKIIPCFIELGICVYRPVPMLLIRVSRVAKAAILQNSLLAGKKWVEQGTICAVAPASRGHN